MKKIFFLFAIAALVLATSCSKNVKCKCTSLTTNSLGKYDTTIISTDSGFSCKKITKIGFERRLEGEFVRELVDVSCEEVKD